jgi:parvulin-like peptidyl-prolyl isomerase
MGYLHEGTMPDPVVLEVRKMKPGELSPAVRLLEGYSVFRLDERKPAQLRSFEDVKERASQLWAREESARRWNEFVASLRRATPIRIDKTRYPALAEALTPVRPAD